MKKRGRKIPRWAFDPHNKMARKYLKVAERDKWICQICYAEVLPEDASIDHIVSRGNGGTDAYVNLQLCHHKCNCWKNKNIDQKKNLGIP